MKKLLVLSISASVLASAYLQNPVCAQQNQNAWIENESTHNKNQIQMNQPPMQRMHMQDIDVQPQKTEKIEKTQTHQNAAQKAASVPMSVAGAMAGVTIGVPVKVCKSIGHYTKSMHASMKDGVGVEDKEIDLGGKSISAACSYPYGVVSGIIHGTIKGVERGLEAGIKKPFSKESFSLTDPKQSVSSN